MGTLTMSGPEDNDREATEDDASPRTAATATAAPRKLDVGMEEAGVEMTTVRQQGMQMLDEVQQAETLMQDLTNRRNNRKKELAAITLRSQRDDVSAEIRSARQRSRKKIAKGDDDADDVRESEVAEEIQPAKRDADLATAQSQLAADQPDAASAGGSKGGQVRDRQPGSQLLDTAEGVSPKAALGASMRERLRSKVLSAKEKAETDAREEALSPPRRTLRGLRSKPLAATRFDDGLANKENFEIEEQLEKSMDARSKWKKVAQKALGKTHLPTRQEQFDFFVTTFDDDEDDAKRMSTQKAEQRFEKSRRMPAPADGSTAVDGSAKEAAGGTDGQAAVTGTDTADGAASGGDGDGTAVTVTGADATADQPKATKTPALPMFDLDVRPFVMAPATYVPSKERLDQERQTYYVPSILSVPEKDKIPTNLGPRYLEEEGFYVGERLLLPEKNQNKMEHRLLKEVDGKGRMWFGEDGKILALPNPVKETPARPLIPENRDPAIELTYRKAITKEFDSRYIDGSLEEQGSGLGRYQLDIDVNTVAFIHHHLFSREHALASRLTYLCRQHSLRRHRDIVTYLLEKLKALRSAIENAKTSMMNLKPSKILTAAADQLEKRQQEYITELRQTRQQCDIEEKADAELLKGIVQTWKQLKELRQLQGYCSTPAKLKLHRREANLEDDERLWQQNIEYRLFEARLDYAEEYEVASAKYSTDLAAFKEQRKAKKAAQAKKKKKLAGGESSSRSATDEQALVAADSDGSILNEPDLVKPLPPVSFDELSAREKINDKMLQLCLRRPGEPHITPELVDEAVITPDNQCPRGEQLRRNGVDAASIFVKVLFNGKEVCRTKTRVLGRDFVVVFGEIFSIQIIEWPQSIMLELCDDGRLTSTVLADVYAAIPEATVTPNVVTLDEIEFSSDRVVRYDHEGIGSGVPTTLTADGSGTHVMFTSGTILMSVCWGMDESGQALVPQPNTPAAAALNAVRGLDPVAAIGASAMVDMDKLAKWINESRLDPNDPANANLAYLLRPISGQDGRRILDYFRLEQLQEEFNFATDEDLELDRRYQLLQFREKEIQEFRNYKLVPPYEKEVPQDIFAEYEKRTKAEAAAASVDSSVAGPGSNRAAVAKFKQGVREQVFMRFRAAAHQKTLQDVVYEDAVPNIAGIVLNLGALVEPRRPLQPKRMERKKVAAHNLHDRDVHIMVNVVKAYDVPYRLEESSQAEQQQQQSARAKLITPQLVVRPYVEVVFQHERHCTAVAAGANPSWNEQLQLPFRPPNNDFSAANLQAIKDCIYLNLFDEVVTDVLEDDRQRGKVIHHRIEKRWLGGLQLPFMTLYTCGVIQGTFKLNAPPVLLGYGRDSRSARLQQAIAGNDVDEQQGGGRATAGTYITVYMTVEPPLGMAPEVRQQFESNESEILLQATYNYVTQLESKFPKRSYLAEVIDVTGKVVFVTRYICALKPPEEVLAMAGKAEENVARFVSLIPSASDETSFPGLWDIWSTCDQFLQMLSGDAEEHAVLLTNFFLHLGKDAYLCFGNAVPEGPTAFTLVKEGTKVSLWNATTGDSYDSHDHFCPLLSIGCLINKENIWANIQAQDAPSQIKFDLQNAGAWRPFFTTRFPKPELASNQPDSLSYYSTDKSFVAKEQERIEIILKDKFMQEWRPKHITRWNRLCMHAFKTLLPQLELNRKTGDMLAQHTSELGNILSTYKLSGFPINVPYTDVDAIVEAVYATGVWDNDDPGIEFALAVHIHAYPCSVLSVWIYVASLLRKDKAR